MPEPFNPQGSFLQSVVEPMFKHDSPSVAFQRRFGLEVENARNDLNYFGRMVYPPEIDVDPDLVSLRPIQGELIKTAEENGVPSGVYRTDKPGVYLIVRSKIDGKGKARSVKLLAFVGENKVCGYEADPEDLKPRDI